MQGGVTYPTAYFAGGMNMLADMVGLGLPLRASRSGPAATTPTTASSARSPNNIALLSQSLAAFQADVEARGWRTA